MTDLEMTRLCAEAMGYQHGRPKHQPHTQVWVSGDEYSGSVDDDWFRYDPLHDDAQAMALVKKFRPIIGTALEPTLWHIGFPFTPYWVDNENLNRAIVECLAKMQLEKQK